MNIPPPEDLGHGVEVRPLSSGEIAVVSRGPVLGWQPRAGRAAGTAVRWRDEVWEVVANEGVPEGERWTLVRWPDGEAMRRTVKLDPSAVASLAAAAARERRETHRRAWLLPVLPLLGLAPARLQRRWRDEWGFPAVLATWVSALIELVLWAMMLAQTALCMSGAVRFVPVSWPVSALLAFLLLEGYLRLRLVNADSEPVGSVFTLWLVPFLSAEPPPPAPSAAPVVDRADEAAGELEVVSPVLRRDWVHGAWLEHRSVAYVLEGLERSGNGWRYRFLRAPTGSAPGPSVRLAPPPAAPVAPGRSGVREPLVDGIITGLVCVAPAAVQAAWADRMGIRPQWLTLIGACAELVGGLTGLADPETSLADLLHVLLVADGGVRLVLALLGGRPVGSVLGLPFGSAWRRVIHRARRRPSSR